MSSILRTGANGFVGGHVLPALLAAGHDVVALVRSHRTRNELVARLDPALHARVMFRRLGQRRSPSTFRNRDGMTRRRQR